MNKAIMALLMASTIFMSYGYYGSTTAPVAISGGIIKAKSVEIVQKYKRKDCPVCKGTGWYMSGDKIKKIECSYCEADKGTISIGEIISINPTAPVTQQPNCKNGPCKPSSIIRR
jgi:hypothetical protein